jgi:clan AA aspartic protease
MITGSVNDDREAIVSLTVRGPTGRMRRIRAVIDTGYNGRLTLPLDVVVELKLRWIRRGFALLADNSEVEFDVYEANVVWDGRRRVIRIDATDSGPLLGMALMEGYELKAQIRRGGKVTLKPLARPRKG